MNDNAQKLAGTLSVFLILATVVWGVLNLSEGLESSRPPEFATGADFPGESQKVAARLWQDPFEAFQALSPAAGTTSPPPPGLGFPSPSLRREITTRTDGLMILGVTLEGTSFPADKEVRRRLRYAIEVALLNAGFAPEDRNHIGVQAVAVTNAPGGSAHLAFEWFNATAQAPAARPRHALVLWLREDDLASQPLRTLGVLLEEIGVDRSSTNTSFCLLGPRSSDTLRAMANTEPGDFWCGLAASGRFRILSPEATVPDYLLFGEGASGRTAALGPGRPEIQSRSSSHLGTNVFENWIATDYQLAGRLVTELGNRNRKPVQAKTRHGEPAISPHDVIVVVSEADTFYGRSMPAAIELALGETQPEWPRSNFWHFSYLRGLEGTKPAGTGAAEALAARTPTASPEALVAAALQERKGERAEGEAQRDYAQRLGALLEDREAGLRARGGKIMAVGLTGNDVYDKLVLLRALRKRLPDAIFFTTDLDARLYAPEELKYTRHLLVASAYGVDPRPPHEQFLPFRDLYQTAVFAACRAAVSKARGIDERPAPANLEGRLYEIGRRGPVEFDAPGSAASFDLGQVLGQMMGWVVLALAAVAVPAWFAMTLLGGLRRTRSADPAETGPAGTWSWPNAAPKFVCGAALAGMVLLLQFGQVISRFPGEEPWSFADGISIWPTETIRLGALLLGLAFLVLAPRAHQSHRRQLWKEYFSVFDFDRLLARPRSRRLAGWRVLFPDQQTGSGPRLLRRVWAAIRANSISGWKVPRRQARVDARALFKGYAIRGLVPNRFLRVAFWTATYFAFVMVTMSLVSEPPTHLCIRGAWSAGIDLLTLAVTIGCFLFVLFYALDAARLTGRMLYCLCDGPTRWPALLTDKWARRKAVRPQDLDGWLDVRFAADKTRETGRLMFHPFIIFLLLLISRNSYFENWSWPGSLVGVFVLNFVLAAACWGLVRHSAREVRRLALQKIDGLVLELRTGSVVEFAVPASDPPAQVTVKRSDYLKRLKQLRQEMVDERRGAFTHWIQDPTYIALFVPTGITGILTVVLHYWLSGR